MNNRSMAGGLWCAVVFSGFCAIIFYRSSDFSGYECGYQSFPASGLVFRLWCSYLSKEKMFFGINVGLSTWSSAFCMQTMELPSLKQKMFNDLLRRKFTKSRFRYYPNDDASFNVELNPGPPAERQDSVQSKTISLFRSPTRITQRFENHMRFNHPYRFEYANSTNLVTCVLHQRIYIFVYSTLDQSETKPWL